MWEGDSTNKKDLTNKQMYDMMILYVSWFLSLASAKLAWVSEFYMANLNKTNKPTNTVPGPRAARLPNFPSPQTKKLLKQLSKEELGQGPVRRPCGSTPPRLTARRETCASNTKKIVLVVDSNTTLGPLGSVKSIIGCKRTQVHSFSIL